MDLHPKRNSQMSICIIYDCLYPHTVGGAERWYRNLALRLADEGHDVTYLTMRQWDKQTPPDLPGVRVIAAAPRMHLYAAAGRRRIWPPVAFGLGVLRHLARHGSRYDIVHTASFPYFPLLAAGLLRRRGRYRLLVDWHEVWSREYWNEYLGPLGAIGFSVQSLCMHLHQEAFCFSRLHARRLRGRGGAGRVTVLRGQYEADPNTVVHPAEPDGGKSTIVFAGRHIPEKRVTAIVPAFLHARETFPELRCLIFGDGPDRAELLAQIDSNGLSDVTESPGFVAQEQVEDALQSALCLLLPSRREGYGLIVVEALARGTPVVVVDGLDNAAVELVMPGVNGFVAEAVSPEALAEAILRVQTGGAALRESTAAWYARNARMLSLECSLETVANIYAH
jgi:glycosyltransferase involved in cell wall biosynthesis